MMIFHSYVSLPEGNMGIIWIIIGIVYPIIIPIIISNGYYLAICILSHINPIDG